jgi:hypothetical protein
MGEENFEIMKMTVFWDFAPCSLMEVDGRFGITTRHKITEDSDLLTR